MKRCSKCKKLKPITEFFKEQEHKDGLRSECKECSMVRLKAWRERNIEWCKIRDTKHHAKYYKEHPNYNKEHSLKWRQENSERAKESHRKYIMKHRDKVALYQARYESRKLSLEATLTHEQWQSLKLLFKNRCAYCGKRTKSLEKEHVIPVSSGGTLTLGNIVPACRSCNAKKHKNLPSIPVKLVLI